MRHLYFNIMRFYYKIIYFIGILFGKRFRLWYHRYTGGKWCWGILQFSLDKEAT